MAAKGFSAHCQTGRGKVAADPARPLRLLPMSTLPYAGAETEPELPEPEPNADALALHRAMIENDMLRAANKRLESTLRIVGKALAPYIRELNGDQR